MSQPQPMRRLVYFDTDAFHHFATTYQDRLLPDRLRSRIVLSPITMLEVFTHLVLESTHRQLRGLPNWMNKQDVHLLAWPEEAIAEMVFGISPKGDWFLDKVEAILNECLMGTPAELFEGACELQAGVNQFKEQRASNFLPLMHLCRNDAELVNGFDDEWLKCVIPGLRSGEVRLNGDVQKAKLLEALGAYHEFELRKVKVAVANPYNPHKHQNDALDSQQLAYLCDRTLHFITCDKGYLNKVQRSAQRNRIHETSQETLSSPDKAEELLARVFGS
jgi:hypothetical protein